MTASTEQERAEFTDGAWYWVEKEGWHGEPPIIAPAMYKADCKAWYSHGFGGISTCFLKVLEPCKRGQQASRRAQVVLVPQSIEQMAVDRYKVVPSHSSMFYPCAVVAGDGQQQLYIGREVECQNMARKFTGAFLDGAFVALAAAPQPPEAAPVELPEPVYTMRVRGRMHDYTPTLSAFDLADGEHELYTEHQVRQLLAAHGIQEQST